MGIFSKEQEQTKTERIEVGKKKELIELPKIEKSKEEVVEEIKQEVPELTDVQKETVSLINYYHETYGFIDSDSNIKTTNTLLFGVMVEIIKLRIQLEEMSKKE